jgi:hypothetical protein
MSDVLGRSISPQRFNMLMLATFSGLALGARMSLPQSRPLGIRSDSGPRGPEFPGPKMTRAEYLRQAAVWVRFGFASA